MNTAAHMVAQALAPDHLWPVLVLLATLAVMAALRAAGNHLAAWRRARHYFHQLHGGRHGPKLHGHH
ncbi:MAG: hypothetical protein JW741_07250 [Sedimentisphaerales bacterium]|nr:hypothetical protein [Sedimentisphaerales bacterium]